MRRLWRAVAGTAFFLLMVGPALDAEGSVFGATVADASNGNYALTSVSVTRGAAGAFTHVPSQLTGVDLTDVDAFQLPILVPSGASLPASGTRAALLEDGRLDIGIINITNSSADRTRRVPTSSG